MKQNYKEMDCQNNLKEDSIIENACLASKVIKWRGEMTACSKSIYLGLTRCIFISDFEDNVCQKCEWFASTSVMWEQEGAGRERSCFIDQFSVFWESSSQLRWLGCWVVKRFPNLAGLWVSLKRSSWRRHLPVKWDSVGPACAGRASSAPV